MSLQSMCKLIRLRIVEEIRFMRKTRLIIANIALLLWYFLSMTGLKIGDKYLVTGAFEEEWLFMLIPTITFVLMLVTKNVGRNIHLIWLVGWFVTQFLSHEWYTLFGRGFMGEMDKKIAFFQNAFN